MVTNSVRIFAVFVAMLLLVSIIPVAAISAPTQALNIILCDAFSVGDQNGQVTVGKTVFFFSTVMNLQNTPMVYDYQWNLGEGSPRTSGSTSYPYMSEGPKIVTLYVAERGNPGNSCFDTLTLNVLPQPFNNPPVPTIFLTNQQKDELLVGKGVAFSSTVVDLEGDQVTYHWSFGDGETSPAQHPTHPFKEAGKKTVTLLVTQVNDPSKSGFASMDVDIKADTVVNPLAINIVPTQTEGADPLTVVFSVSGLDASTEYTYQWNFGDGSTSQRADPVHVFYNQENVSKTYSVSLVVAEKDNPARSGYDSQDITVRASASQGGVANRAPVLRSVTATPQLAERGQLITFTTVASDEDNDFLSYHYDFGDGAKSTVTGATQTHAYDRSGEFAVTVTVFDSRGATAVGSTLASIGGADLAPIALATASPSDGNAPLSVTFFGQGIDRDGRIVSYHWDFGDGTSSDQQSPVKLYSLPGVYRAVLTVFDDDGAQGRDDLLITVRSPGTNPAPLIQDIPDLTAVIGQAFSFPVVASDPFNEPLSYFASGLSDGLSINAQTGLISGTPVKLGVNVVMVTVGDPAGNTATDSFTLTVVAPGQQPTPPVTQQLIPGMQISRARLADDRLNVGDLVMADIKVANSGNMKLEDVKIRISVLELGIAQSVLVRDMSKQEDEVRGLSLELPQHTPVGEYTLRITVSNDQLNRRIHRVFTVTQ